MPALCLSRIIIEVQSLFARSWWTRRDGVFFCIRLKKSPQLPLVGSIFSGECRTPLFLPSCKCVNERTNFKQRLYALKKISLYDTEQQTYQKYELHSFSSSYRIKKGGKSDRDNSRSDSLLSKALKRLVGVLLWAILKPIFRGVGWIMSILTAIGIRGCSQFLSVLDL